ncbi:amidohydrolase [Pseudoruegeria sp. HB172150]|uniref:amidohydrolase family protein n=1 Tax=Pseudoruegeria sp. HB172150 TaxID=2721164 RepID=UPI001557512B|nr:amidohydrolase family protein [Pseudoruegeria sp. HB172150]
MTQVDAHHHYWNPARGDYHWMPQDDPVLSRPYGPADLKPAMAAKGIDRTVLVQAAATLEETEYLLGIADATPHVAGVVGWVDFEKPSHRTQLERFAAHPKFKGVRPMIQDIEDDAWMLRPDIQWAFQAIVDLDLTFDALGFPRHLQKFFTILTRYPQMRVVIDHCMKPQIRAHSRESFRQWADGMTALARETGACCKLSGLVTEASENPTLPDLRPYADHVLDVFGPNRVMWGSDWPVCRLRVEYETWFDIAESLTQGLDSRDKAQVFGGSASAFYRLAN